VAVGQAASGKNRGLVSQLVVNRVAAILVWHQITHNSNTGLPILQQPLTSIHIFDIKEPKSEPREKSDNSDNKPTEEEDLDDELAQRAGGLYINNQIRETGIPKELTPQRDTISLPRYTKLSPISPKLSTMATSSITIQQPADTQPLTQGGGRWLKL